MNCLLLNLASYKYCIADWLIQEKKSEKVYITYLPGIQSEVNENELSENVEFVKIEQIMKRGSTVEKEVAELPPLGKKDMEEALPYEAMFLQLAAHRYAYPIGAADQGKSDYLFFLRFWNDFFKKNNIGFVMFDDVPHWPIIYAAYVTAKIHATKVCILAPIGIHVPNMEGSIHIYGDSIETLGSTIEKEYNELVKGNMTNAPLEGIIKQYFDMSLRKKNDATLSSGIRKKMNKQLQVEKFKTPTGRHAELTVVKHNIYYYLSAKLKHKNIERYLNNRYDIRNIRDMKQLRLFYSYDVSTLKEYDKKAKYPDRYNDKFILFPLQIWPEATTEPQSGVFAEQYNAIQLLSYITRKRGIKIYVKEYYLQPVRSKVFWRELSQLENVVLIKSDVTSGELMEKAIAVANQTGTCLMEAPFYGKPAITFGDGFCLKGMPGLFEITDVAQGEKIIDQIVSGVDISMDELKRYYYAIQKKSIFFHRSSLWEIKENSDEYKMTVEGIKRILNEVLN